MTGNAIRIAMFIRWRVKIRSKTRFKVLVGTAGAVSWNAGLSIAEGESMVLRYPSHNEAGKHNRKGANTRWYCSAYPPLQEVTPDSKKRPLENEGHQGGDALRVDFVFGAEMVAHQSLFHAEFRPEGDHDQ